MECFLACGFANVLLESTDTISAEYTANLIGKDAACMMMYQYYLAAHMVFNTNQHKFDLIEVIMAFEIETTYSNGTPLFPLFSSSTFLGMRQAIINDCTDDYMLFPTLPETQLSRLRK